MTEALGRYIEAHGGVILPNKPVAKLIVEGGKCTGVECVDGSSYRAQKAVVSTIHIKQLVDMAPRQLWGQDFIDGVETWQAECTLMSLQPTLPRNHPSTQWKAALFRRCTRDLCPTLDRALRFGYDYARGAVNVEDPPLHIVCCSVVDPTRALRECTL